MHVANAGALWSYIERPEHEDAVGPIRAWYAEARQATWRTPLEVRASYQSAIFLSASQIAFRLWQGRIELNVRLNYACQVVLIMALGEIRTSKPISKGLLDQRVR